MFNPRVLFLVKRRNLTYTPPFGLLYSAAFVADLLHRHHIDAKVVQVTDGNDIDKEVVNFNPTHVIIEALWATPAKVRRTSQGICGFRAPQRQLRDMVTQ